MPKSDEWTRTEGPYTRFLISSGKSPNTARTYGSGVKLYWEWCAKYEMTPFDAARSDLRSWLTERLETISSSRCHNDLAGIRLFYAWLIETGYREDDPTKGVRVKRGKRLPTKPLSGPELERLVEASQTERDRLILLMLAYSGLRITELAQMTAERIDWESGEVRVVGKGDKERRIAPSPEIMGRLHAFCGMFPEGPVWVSDWGRPLAAHQIRKIIYRIAAQAKLPDVHPHRFRSMFGTSYIEQFADIQALQYVMGHESIETTARYTQWTREKRGLKQMRGLNFDDRKVG